MRPYLPNDPIYSERPEQELPTGGKIVCIVVIHRHYKYAHVEYTKTAISVWHRKDGADTDDCTFWVDYARHGEDDRNAVARIVRQFAERGARVDQEWFEDGMRRLKWSFIREEQTQCA